MATQFNGFRATKPVVRLIDTVKGNYEVFFIVYKEDGKKLPFRYKRSINSLPRKADRQMKAEVIADELWKALVSGWNPIQHRFPEVSSNHEPVKLPFPEALEFALAKKKSLLSKYSFYDYSGCVRFLIKAMKSCGFSNSLVGNVQRRDIRLLMATAKEENSWSNRARNKYLSIVKALLSVLVDEEMIPFNPAHAIKNEPEEESQGYRRLTDAEKETIALHLAEKCPAYFEYLMFIYQSGIRRTELLQIKIKDINLQRRELTVRASVAKTNRERTVPITDDLMEILIGREIYKHPREWYLFSSRDFAPGEGFFHPNTPTNWWRQIVQLGLKIDCKMYSLKHKGADDKIKAGLDIDVLRTLYGHRSKQMTEIYAKEVKNSYKEQIIQHSPVFAKVVHMKKKAE